MYHVQDKLSKAILESYSRQDAALYRVRTLNDIAKRPQYILYQDKKDNMNSLETNVSEATNTIYTSLIELEGKVYDHLIVVSKHDGMKDFVGANLADLWISGDETPMATVQLIREQLAVGEPVFVFTYGEGVLLFRARSEDALCTRLSLARSELCDAFAHRILGI